MAILKRIGDDGQDCCLKSWYNNNLEESKVVKWGHLSLGPLSEKQSLMRANQETNGKNCIFNFLHTILLYTIHVLQIDWHSHWHTHKWVFLH